MKNRRFKRKNMVDFTFSLKEIKWAEEAITDCYKRFENGTAKQLKAKIPSKNVV